MVGNRVDGKRDIALLIMNKPIKLYIVLCSIFCTIIISSNMIFQKFVIFNIFGNVFEISAGVLFYPVTFLISDLVAEFYGESYAKLMVRTAISCSIIVFILIYIASILDAASWSLIDNKTFNDVFNVYGVGALSSIIANYLGQRADIKIYLYLKHRAAGKHLWFRNNISTFVGQIVDTLVILSLLNLFGVIPFEQYATIALSSLVFKIVASILDTPFCYMSYYLINKFVFAKTT